MCIDESDFFFEDDRNFALIEKIFKYVEKSKAKDSKIQYLMFSATQGSGKRNTKKVYDRMSKYLPEANMIKKSPDVMMAKLDHIN